MERPGCCDFPCLNFLLFACIKFVKAQNSYKCCLMDKFIFRDRGQNTTKSVFSLWPSLGSVLKRFLRVSYCLSSKPWYLNLAVRDNYHNFLHIGRQGGFVCA